MQEPKDGDFVAYIEALQRESAARLARERSNGAEASFASKAPGPGGPERAASSSTSTQPAAKMSPRFTRDRDATLVRALVAGVVGATLLLSWLGNGGLFAFIIGIALLAYALPRLFRALRASGKAGSHRALIDQVFERSGTPPRGTGK